MYQAYSIQHTAYSIHMNTGGYNISQIPAHRADSLDDLDDNPQLRTHLPTSVEGGNRCLSGISDNRHGINCRHRVPPARRLSSLSQFVHPSFLPFPKTSGPCLREFNKSAAQLPLMRAAIAILQDSHGPKIDGRWRRKAAHKVETKTIDEEEKDVYTNTMNYFRLHQRRRKG